MLVVVVILELVTFTTYGWYIERKTRDRIMAHISDFDHLNWFDDDILSSRKHNSYIAKIDLHLTSKYHVSDIGIVPRFTHLSYAIGKRFKEIKETESKKAKALKSFDND